MCSIKLPNLDDLKDYVPPPRPIPNIGYCGLNKTIGETKPLKNRIFTSRTCTLKTFKEKGVDYISELILKNVHDLAIIIQWNHENGIRLFRMSSEIFPWNSYWQWKELKDYDEIKKKCFYAGELARIYDQRLTFHPSHYVQLASLKSDVVEKSIKDLEIHSEFLDMMGFEPSLWNKLNFHIGGVYNDKQSAIERWKQNFNLLSENCKKRIAIENDDKPDCYSVDDLLPVVKELGIALTYDLHHYKFCNDKLSAKEAFLAAIETWGDVTPIIHWSESPKDLSKRRSAHSDYVTHLDLWGNEHKVDVMIEAKFKELALLKYRDEILPKELLEREEQNIEDKLSKTNI